MLQELKLSHGFEREKKAALTVAQQNLLSIPVQRSAKRKNEPER